MLFVCVSTVELRVVECVCEFCCRMTLARARTGICNRASPAEIGARRYQGHRDSCGTMSIS